MIFLEEYKDGYRRIDFKSFLKITKLTFKDKEYKEKGVVPKVIGGDVVLGGVEFETVSIISSKVSFIRGFSGTCSFLPINNDLGIFTLFTGGFNLKIYDEEGKSQGNKIYIPNTDVVNLQAPYVIDQEDKAFVTISLLKSSLGLRFKGIDDNLDNYITVFNYTSKKDFPVIYYDFNTTLKYTDKIKELDEYNASCLSGCGGVGIKVVAVIPKTNDGKKKIKVAINNIEVEKEIEAVSEDIGLIVDKKQKEENKEINVDDVISNFFT